MIKPLLLIGLKRGATIKKGAKILIFPHQKLISDYLQASSPYRGILLYHGLGVGKTCASIAIAEGFILIERSLFC